MSGRGLICTLLLAASATARLAATPAGLATVSESGRAAFTQHVAGLDERQLKAFALGNRIFSTDWIAAPASVEYFDGLGPYFSQRSCSGCHLRDGRGRPSSGAPEEPGNLVIGLARETGDGRLAPDPVYGEQLSFDNTSSEYFSVISHKYSRQALVKRQ